MSEQQKKELENAMNLQAEAQAAEARGQQMAMEKAGEMTQEIAQDVAEGTKKVYQSIEKGVVDGYKAIENGVVSGYKAIENGVVGSFNKITDTLKRRQSDARRNRKQIHNTHHQLHQIFRPCAEKRHLQIPGASRREAPGKEDGSKSAAQGTASWKRGASGKADREAAGITEPGCEHHGPIG